MRQSSQLLYSLIICVLTAVIPEGAAQKRGQVISKPCPHSCSTLGLSKSKCRDWREGNTCYVEDLTKPPVAPNVEAGAINNESPAQEEGSDTQACSGVSRDEISKPYINVDQRKAAGNFFGGEERVRGSIEGICLVEAGCFEEGRKVKTIPITTTRQFGRYEFECKLNTGKTPEIRAYNSIGERDIATIADESDEYAASDQDDFDDYLGGEKDRYRRGSSASDTLWPSRPARDDDDERW